MDVSKITLEEIKGMSKAKLKEVEGSLRKEIANLKMGGYLSASINSAKVDRHKRDLARVLTFCNVQEKKAGNK